MENAMMKYISGFLAKVTKYPMESICLKIYKQTSSNHENAPELI